MASSVHGSGRSRLARAGTAYRWYRTVDHVRFAIAVRFISATRYCHIISIFTFCKGKGVQDFESFCRPLAASIGVSPLAPRQSRLYGISEDFHLLRIIRQFYAKLHRRFNCSCNGTVMHIRQMNGISRGSDDSCVYGVRGSSDSHVLAYLESRRHCCS